MPISSRASQKCLQVFSTHSGLSFTRQLQIQGRPQVILEQSFRHRRPSCPSTARGYATAGSKMKPKDTAIGPSKAKSPPKVPATGRPPGRLSASGAKNSMRIAHFQQQMKEKASKREQIEHDPEAAASYMNQAANIPAGIDVWARAEPDILDVTLPLRNGSFWGLNAVKYTLDNATNNLKSCMSIYLLAKAKTPFPPLYSVPEYPYEPNIRPPASTAPNQVKLYNLEHISQLLRFSSTSPKAWIAGIPGLSLHLYLQMCKAIAENDRATLRRVTCSPQLDQALKAIGNRDPELVYTWKFIKENSPTRIVSIRATQFYNAKHEPRNGLNRMLINALVRFDTIQSLEISTKPKQKTSGGATAVASDSDGNATQKRVVEYYVIQKKGWVAQPWTIRERIYDTSGFGESEAGSQGSYITGGGLSRVLRHFKSWVGWR